MLWKYPSGRGASARGEEPRGPSRRDSPGSHAAAPPGRGAPTTTKGSRKDGFWMNWRHCGLKDTDCAVLPQGLAKVTAFLHVSALQPEGKLFLLTVSQRRFQPPSISPGNTSKGDMPAPTRRRVPLAGLTPPVVAGGQEDGVGLGQAQRAAAGRSGEPPARSDRAAPVPKHSLRLLHRTRGWTMLQKQELLPQNLLLTLKGQTHSILLTTTVCLY